MSDKKKSSGKGRSIIVNCFFTETECAHFRILGRVFQHGRRELMRRALDSLFSCKVAGRKYPVYDALYHIVNEWADKKLLAQRAKAAERPAAFRRVGLQIPAEHYERLARVAAWLEMDVATLLAEYIVEALSVEIDTEANLARWFEVFQGDLLEVSGISLPDEKKSPWLQHLNFPVKSGIRPAPESAPA